MTQDAAYFNFEVEGFHTYFVSADTRSPAIWVHNRCTPARRAAWRQAKRDAGVPNSAHPEAVRRVPMTDSAGKRILDDSGQPVMTREYVFNRGDGSKIVIQDHAAGHRFGQGGVGDQGAHFNVRPFENTRTGKVPGTDPHYPFKR